MADSLSVKVVHKTQIDELLRISPQFSFIKDKTLSENDSIYWKMNDENAFCIQVMFIGKTGYGKSTTLNKICGYQYFETDDVNICTKSLFSCEYKISDHREHYFSLCDLPGVGESSNADETYTRWYVEMLKKSACVVYLLRADQRDYSVDKEIINTIIDNSERISEKLIIGLNYADKIEPVSRISPFLPCLEQLRNLNKKLKTISELFNIDSGKVIYYSASDGYNLNDLKDSIARVVKTCLL
jgi:predicted GTPase